MPMYHAHCFYCEGPVHVALQKETPHFSRLTQNAKDWVDAEVNPQPTFRLVCEECNASFKEISAKEAIEWVSESKG